MRHGIARIGEQALLLMALDELFAVRDRTFAALLVLNRVRTQLHNGIATVTLATAFTRRSYFVDGDSTVVALQA